MNPLLRRVANLEKRIAPPDDEDDRLDYSLLLSEEERWLRDIIDRTPLYEGKIDLTLLTDDELEELSRIITKATPHEGVRPKSDSSSARS
jgi:hypothetical protein